MARVKIEPGGKVLIAMFILSTLLFLFFSVIRSKGGKPQIPESQQTEQAIQAEVSPAQTESTAAAEQQPPTQPAQVTKQQERPTGPATVFFAFNRAGINKNVYCIFDRIERAVRLEGAEGLRIVVEGNADSIGPREYNMILSKKRAERVADSLSRRLGIPLNEIEIVANGYSKPIASNSTPAGRADNRRTEVYIYH